MGKELFENNKIVEALCKFSFEPQSQQIYQEYKDLLGKDNSYPNTEDLTAFSFTATGGEETVTSSVINGMKYTNSEGDKVLQLYNNTLSIHQILKYRNWEEFSGDIKKATESFSTIAIPTINRIDLKTINVFTFPLTDDFGLDKHFNLYVTQPERFKSSLLNLLIEYPTDTPNDFITIRLNAGIQNNSVVVVLDIGFVNLATNLTFNKTDDIFNIIERGHSEMYALFCDILTPSTKELIK